MSDDDAASHLDLSSLCIRGYASALFRDDAAAASLAAGTHLVPLQPLRATSAGAASRGRDYERAAGGAATHALARALGGDDDVIVLGLRSRTALGHAAEAPPAASALPPELEDEAGAAVLVDRFDGRLLLAGLQDAGMASAAGEAGDSAALLARLERERYRDLPEHELWEPPPAPPPLPLWEPPPLFPAQVWPTGGGDEGSGAAPLVSFVSANARFLMSADASRVEAGGGGMAAGGGGVVQQEGEAGISAAGAVVHGGSAAGGMVEGGGAWVSAPSPPVLALSFHAPFDSIDAPLPRTLVEYRVLVATARAVAAEGRLVRQGGGGGCGGGGGGGSGGESDARAGGGCLPECSGAETAPLEASSEAVPLQGHTEAVLSHVSRLEAAPPHDSHLEAALLARCEVDPRFTFLLQGHPDRRMYEALRSRARALPTDADADWPDPIVEGGIKTVEAAEPQGSRVNSAPVAAPAKAEVLPSVGGLLGSAYNSSESEGD